MKLYVVERRPVREGDNPLEWIPDVMNHNLDVAEHVLGKLRVAYPAMEWRITPYVRESEAERWKLLFEKEAMKAFVE